MSTGFTELNVTNDPSFLYCTTSHFILCDKMDIKGNRTYDSNNIRENILKILLRRNGTSTSEKKLFGLQH
uniref:Uncharacterized protein n=1 Tax=Rhizophagus irregularis (strain DAOM 181602 / DAOM 197198 / MUCL 43194) TaxID=747089 RepID=U9TXF3_RHIID